MDGEVLKVVIGEGLDKATLHIARDGDGTLVRVSSVYNEGPGLWRFSNIHPEDVRLELLIELAKSHDERAKDGHQG